MPRLSDLRVVDPVLTNIARGYSNSNFIGEQLFPIVNVETGGGKIPLWGKEAFLIWKTERALRGDSNEMEGGWLKTTPYSCIEHDLVSKLDYLEIAETKLLSRQTLAVNQVMEAIGLRREKMYADLCQDLNTYPTDNKITLTDDFYNEDEVDFITAIKKAADKMVSIIGKRPNTMVLPFNVWRCLQSNKILKSYLSLLSISGNEFGAIVPSPEALQKLVQIDKILVGQSVYIKKIEAEAKFLQVWGNNIGLYYIAPPTAVERTPQEPCFGYTLRWNNFPNTDIYPTEGQKIINVRTTDNFDVKVVGAESGMLIHNPIDPSIYAEMEA